MLHVKRKYDETAKRKVSRVCTNDEILEGGTDVHTRCFVAAIGSRHRCGVFFTSPECRTIRIYKKNWEDENVSKKIIFAAFHPCEFLMDVSGYNKEDFSKKTNLYRDKFGDEIAGGLYRHQRVWADAGCSGLSGEAILPRVIYFEIHNDKTNRIGDQTYPAIKVYKATINNNNNMIGGEYVGL